MLEIYFDDRGELAIESLPALFKAFPEHAERATASALKSEGYRLRNILKAAVKSQMDGEWDELNPHTGTISRGKKRSIKNFKMVWRGEKGSKKRVRAYWSRTPAKGALSKRRNPLARFAGAMRYRYDADIQAVPIGFLDSALSGGMMRLAEMHTKGYSTPVTPKMRKMLFALGMPIKKSTKTIKTPPRPLIDPVFDREEEQTLKNIDLKLIAALQRYLYGGKKR